MRARPPMRRLVRSWYREQRGGSPFRGDMAAQGRRGTWRSTSESAAASARVAERLAIEPGEPVMCTSYVFLADDVPAMLSISWEPLEVTRGTEIVLPEEGPHAGKGVVERMAVIGMRITEATEVVGARPVLASEARDLEVPTGTSAITIARTYRTDERPVETADIVVPADRYEVAYSIPVGRGEV